MVSYDGEQMWKWKGEIKGGKLMPKASTETREYLSSDEEDNEALYEIEEQIGNFILLFRTCIHTKINKQECKLWFHSRAFPQSCEIIFQ